ncbi:MAG: RHS repeat-associated core domain-containing protein [Spirochaetaceae bacterium]|nr:RHS repeat-associated core domain-containing protein [Spirochaetaceae bacterium]
MYDGRSFEVIREGPSYRDGQLTTRSASGPVQASGQNGGTAGNGVVNNGAAPSNTPTGERYRWLSEGQEGRTRSTASRTTTGQTARYEGISVTLYGNGKAVGLSRSASAGTRGGAVGRTVVGAVYLGTDILGSVRSSTNELGVLEDRYEYDAFGTPYKGDLESGMNRGYTGKPYDSATGLYNYGYRDYEPATTRFTTTDPVRDGTNWFAYVNKDPVNWVDPWGLSGSDRGSNGGQDEVQYIAQTVQYNLNPVYYYEETVKSEITVYGLNRQSYTYNQDFHYTYYSDDKMAITQHRDDKMDPLKNNPVIIQNPKNEREFLDSTQNKYRRIDVTITYGQIYKSELPTNRPMPQNGRVIRVNNTASASGFKPQGQ